MNKNPDRKKIKQFGLEVKPPIGTCESMNYMRSVPKLF